MAAAAFLGVFFQFAFFGLCGVALIYFILKRIQDKKEERFEQREY